MSTSQSNLALNLKAALVEQVFEYNERKRISYLRTGPTPADRCFRITAVFYFLWEHKYHACAAGGPLWNDAH